MSSSMSDSLLAMLSQQIDAKTVSQIGGQLGVDQKTAGVAISAALPVLMGALARNSQPAVARRPRRPLDRDHDGSILDDLGGFLGQGEQAMGMGQAILGHVLGGGQQKSAQQAIGQSTGLDTGRWAAPGACWRPSSWASWVAEAQQGLDEGGLSSMLGAERQRIEEAHPKSGDLVSQILDRRRRPSGRRSGQSRVEVAGRSSCRRSLVRLGPAARHSRPCRFPN